MSEDNIEQSDDYVLYSNNVGKRSYQWELWRCCNNLCDFCYLGKDNRHTDKERQLKSLEDLIYNLEHLDYSIYNNISLIGGEFFQGQLADKDVYDQFFKMIDKLVELYVDKKIGSIWITATLTLGDQADLYKTLEIFEKKGVLPLPEYGASGVWICTSWDPQGRFKTKHHLENWEFHMNNIKKRFPWVKRNTTIILQQKFCEMYLNNEFVPKEFMKKFDTSLFYKQPGSYEIEGIETRKAQDSANGIESDDPDELLAEAKHALNDRMGFQFFPDRRTFRKFLLKYAKEDPDTYERLFNIMFRSDELHVNYNEDFKDTSFIRHKGSNMEVALGPESLNEHCRIEPKENKHIMDYATYNDCNECMICDREQIWKSVYGNGVREDEDS